MIALRGARAIGRQQRRMSNSNSTLAPAVYGAFYASVMGFSVMGFSAACSEGQYNPPIGGGGSSSSSAGSSGMTGTAGSGTAGSGTSGAGGSAGAQGSAGSTAVSQVYDFESSLEGFAINYYCPGPVADVGCVAVQAPAPAGDGTDAGAGADATPPTEPAPTSDFYSLVQDGTVGEATPGSAKLTLNLVPAAGSVNFAINFGSGTTPGISLVGKTVRAQVRIEPGPPPTTYAKMYIKTGSMYYYADSGQVTLVPGSWVAITFSTAGTPSYPTAPDPAQYLLGDVREIGLQLAATGIAAAATAEIHIDTISY